jgi:hypothetical protein
VRYEVPDANLRQQSNSCGYYRAQLMPFILNTKPLRAFKL